MPTSRQSSRDFIALAVAVAPGDPDLGRLHDRGAPCVTAVQRLAKAALSQQPPEPQALARAAEPCHAAVRDAVAAVRGPVTVTFLGDTVLFCGQLLKASREVYDAAIELGGLLARCGVSEVRFDPAITLQDLLDFAAAFALAVRDPERRAALVQSNLPNLAVRPTDALLERREPHEDAPAHGEAPPAERVLRFYASALVYMRQFYEALAEGAQPRPNRVKRLAQQLVTLTGADDAALLGLTTMANAHRDDAGRAVQSALLAVALARQITADRAVLCQLAMAALMTDVGRVRLTGPGSRERAARLGEAVEAAIPPATAAACVALGGVNAASAVRTAIAYETTTLEREPLVGPPYQRKLPPLVQSKILVLVRTLLERLAPRDASIAMGLLDALEDLARMPSLDGALLRLLVGLLGVVPIGSVVELEGGEWAVVTGPSARREALDRPRIRRVTDKKGRVLGHTPEVDLGLAPDVGRHPAIVRIVPPKDARMNVARVFLT